MLLRFVRFVGLALVLTALACASAKPLYPGGRRPSGEVATLKMVTNGAITRINGRELEGRHYELLPGEYDIDFRIIVQGSEVHSAMKGRAIRETFVCATRIALEKGRDYEIERARIRSGMERRGERQTAGMADVIYQNVRLSLNAVDGRGKVKTSEPIQCADFAND